MNNYLYGILHNDTVYCRLFAECLNKLPRLKNRILIFTDITSLMLYSHIERIEILFADVSFNNDQLLSIISSDKLFFLYDDELLSSQDIPEEFESHYLLRYRPPEVLFSQAAAIQNSSHKTTFFYPVASNGNISLYNSYPEIIGIFSPLSHDLQMAVGLSLCYELMKDNNILFIDLSRFSSFTNTDITNSHGDFSDFIFYFKGNKNVLNKKFNSLISTDLGFDFLHAPRNGDDLAALSKELFISGLSHLSEEFGYSHIIINFDSHLLPLASYLTCCNRLIVPYYSCCNPINSLYGYLGFSGYESFIPNIYTLQAHNYIEFDYNSSIYDFFNNLNCCCLFPQISDFIKSLNNNKEVMSDG